MSNYRTTKEVMFDPIQIGSRLRMMPRSNMANGEYAYSIVEVLKIHEPGYVHVKILDGTHSGENTDWSIDGDNWGYELLSEWDT